MPEYIPTTEQVREAYQDEMATLPSGSGPGRTYNAAGAEFDRWLAAHDHEVRVGHEKRRKPEPIHVDNIDGQNAAQWLAARDEARDREVAARTLEPIRAAETEWRRTSANPRTWERDWVKADIRFRTQVLAALRSGTEGGTD